MYERHSKDISLISECEFIRYFISENTEEGRLRGGKESLDLLEGINTLLSTLEITLLQEPCTLLLSQVF